MLFGWSRTERDGVDDLRRINRHRDAGNAPVRDRHSGASVRRGTLVDRVLSGAATVNRVTPRALPTRRLDRIATSEFVLVVVVGVSLSRYEERVDLSPHGIVVGSLVGR